MYKRGNSRDPGVRELLDLLGDLEQKGADQEIRNRLKLGLDLIEKRDKYCEQVSLPPSEALRTLYDETMSYPFTKAHEEGKTHWKLSPGMMSGHLEGKFLQSVVSMSNAKRVLEIGMFSGYAALACAEVLPEDGTVTTCEIDPFLEGLAKDFFSKSPHGKKISIRIGPAKDTLLKFVEEKQQFDLVFIDADKAGYTDYFKIVFDQGLLSPGGTIVLDNAMMGGHAYLPDTTNENGIAVRKNNEYLMSRDDIFRVLVPIRDGALIVRRKTDTFH